jgi:hypothetical protein
MTTFDRPSLIARVSKSLLQRGNPRLEMTLIVVVTGTAGFLASFVLLHLGLDRMWLRYPLAVGISYGVFFLLLRLWLVYQQQERFLARDALDVSDVNPLDFLSGNGPSSAANSGSSPWWSDWVPDLDGDEWLAVIVMAVAVLTAVIASVFIIFAAPTLLGEVLLDAVVVAALRRKMIRVAEQHWTLGAMRKTILPFVAVALIFSLAGAIIQQARPEAKSIGGVFHAQRVDR